MKVSIMITSYNLEDYIDAAINSVLSQKMPFDWELLIGDDGSTDGTVAHINKWTNKYPENIKLFIMDRSEAVSKNGTRAAKNRANLLEHASGEYLAYLDGDDQLLGTDKFVRQVEILETEKYKHCSCVAHNIYAYDVPKKEKKPMANTSMPDGIIDTKKYLKSMYFHTNTILFRKCCKEMMLRPEYRGYLNDNFITYLILQYGPIYYLHDLWAQYNLTGNGLWTGKKKIYGCFRNSILCDLEKEVNPSLEKEVFYRHASNFRLIFQLYKPENKEQITPLVADLDESTFSYTLLLYKSKSELSTTERIKRKILRFRVEWIIIKQHLKLS